MSSPNSSFEQTREKQSVKLMHRRARRSAQPLGALVKRLLWLITFSIFTLPAQSKEPLRQNSIVLLQPGFMLEKRVSVQALSDYIKRLNAEASRVVVTFSDRAPRSGAIVFAVRPDGSRKIWLDLKPALTDGDANLLRTKLESTSPCAVQEGTVVAAVNVSLWGGKAKGVSMPMPEEWRAAITSDGVEVTKLVDSLWPAVPASNTSLERTREE